MPLNYTKTALTQVNKKLIRTKLAEVVFPRFVKVDSQRVVGFDTKKYLTVNGAGTTDGGLISAETTVFDSVDINFGSKSTTIRGWMKTVGWNNFALEKAKATGVDIVSEKMAFLNKIANLTIQRVAFIGHPDDERLRGLLTSKEVKVINSVNASAAGIDMSKAIQDMTYDEALTFFGRAFSIILDSIDEDEAGVVPNTIAIDAGDRRYLASLKSKLPGATETALEAIKRSLENMADQSVAILGVPQGFAKKAQEKVSRICIYHNSEEYVVMDIPLSPTIVAPKDIGLVSVQTGMRAEFGGVTFKDERTAMYFDLPLATAKKSKGK